MAVACLLSTSCSDSFFDKVPSNQIVSSNFYKNESDFNLAVNGCYQRLKSEVGFFLYEVEYRGDANNLDAVAVSTQSRYDLDHFQDISTNTILSELWSEEYNCIYRCNAMLDKIDGVSFRKQHQYKGEAKFIRAWCYFNLYRVFGGVPIADKVLSPSQAAGVRRATDDEMYSFLSTELKEAAELLPDSYSGEETGRATNCAANTLLGKVALTFHKYDDAKSALELAKMNSNFGLLGSTASVFDVKNKQNKEVIFAVRYNKAANLGHGAWYNTTNPADERNPRPELTSAYSAEDNRAGLITYAKMSTGNNYEMLKWYDTYDATYTTVTGNDFICLRYADVILMYAEALNELGSGKEALAYVNKIRTRAGIGEMTLDNASSQSEIRKAILDEDQREFALEGHRWFDLVRMGYAVEYFTKLGFQIDSHNLIMPIPNDQIEIVNNDAILWQNPGY